MAVGAYVGLADVIAPDDQDVRLVRRLRMDPDCRQGSGSEARADPSMPVLSPLRAPLRSVRTACVAHVVPLVFFYFSLSSHGQYRASSVYSTNCS
jgi:hypothetical protein